MCAGKRREMPCRYILCVFVCLLSLSTGDVVKAETKPNRLIHEKSPYLLQHAHNPVDWYPWGEEAFEKARKEDKPIFLSIGYSTCHWCHVMEEESFEHADIANLMNESFVSVKVDREERPDIDHIYMQAVMAMTGSGGWPMSVFLTHDLKPFYGGTYFPPEDRWGRPGFPSVLKTISSHWKNNRANVLKSSEELTAVLLQEAHAKAKAGGELGEEVLEKAFRQLAARFDSAHGGFSQAPKFPTAHTLSFLLRYWKRSGNSEALRMVEKTLQEMAKGGMYDQLGGGFHRYSTDERWHIPHFEKMLYDQAILARAYLEAYQATKNGRYAEVAREILDYVLRDMTSPEGGFYSAEDADSLPAGASEGKKREGAFYVWSKKEIEEYLGKEKAELFNFFFGVEADGNAGHDSQGEFPGKNILFQSKSLEETGKKFKKSANETKTILNESKTRLFDIRTKRPRPHLDDKVLTDWNGLMISSLAFGSRILSEPRYAAAAKKAADFILENMISSVIASPAKRGAAISEIASVASRPRNDKLGRLMHRYRDGEAAIDAFLEDYAFFTHGLMDLYEATFNPRYLQEAKNFLNEMIRLFWDIEQGGFFLTSRDSKNLISRTKELYDGAIPSGNSVAALALLRVGRLTMEKRFEEKARSTFAAFSHTVDGYPSGFTQMLMAFDFALGPSREIVIAGDLNDTKAQEMIRLVFSRFLPNQAVLFHPLTPEVARQIEALSPFLKAQLPLEGRATAYVCENYICKLPVTGTEALEKLLDSDVRRSVHNS